MLALAAASCVVTLIAQRGAMMELPLTFRAKNAVVSLAAYLGKFFYPTGLTHRYRYPDSWPVRDVALAAAVLLLITAGAILWRRRCPYLLVGWLWYLGMLVPVLGLVQVGSQPMADRYTYLPMIGVTIALVWLLASLAKAWRWGGVVLGLAGCADGRGADGLRLAADLVLAQLRNAGQPRPRLLSERHAGKPGRRLLLIGSESNGNGPGQQHRVRGDAPKAGAMGHGLLFLLPAQDRLEFVEQRLLPRLDFLFRGGQIEELGTVDLGKLRLAA